MAHLTHEQQKQRAQEEAAHHRDNASVNSMRLPERRFKSKTEMNAEDLVKEGKKQGLEMEIE